MVTLMQVYDAPEASLGTLSPYGRGDYAVVNGVVIPDKVIEELRKLGLPLGWYNAGELQDAVQACSYDSHLVDDNEGLNFRDKLTLTDAEREQHKQHGFRDNITREREARLRGFVNCDDDDAPSIYCN